MEVQTKVRVSQVPVLKKTKSKDLERRGKKEQNGTKVQYYIHALLKKHLIDTDRLSFLYKRKKANRERKN